MPSMYKTPLSSTTGRTDHDTPLASFVNEGNLQVVEYRGLGVGEGGAGVAVNVGMGVGVVVDGGVGVGVGVAAAVALAVARDDGVGWGVEAGPDRCRRSADSFRDGVAAAKRVGVGGVVASMGVGIEAGGWVGVDAVHDKATSTISTANRRSTTKKALLVSAEVG